MKNAEMITHLENIKQLVSTPQGDRYKALTQAIDLLTVRKPDEKPERDNRRYIVFTDCDGDFVDWEDGLYNFSLGKWMQYRRLHREISHVVGWRPLPSFEDEEEGDEQEKSTK